MEIATEAMSAFLPKLGELLKDEYNLDRHVRKGVKSLQTELSMMHVALRKVAGVPSDQLDEQVRIWAGAVRELSCDMEDSIDDFMVRVEKNQDRQLASMGRVITFLGMIKRLFIKGKDLHQISNAIQEAQDLAKELTEQRQRYELDIPSTGTGATVDPRIIALYKDVMELVGIDHTRDELIVKLIGVDEMSNEKQLKTISIVGFGGLGKTTLAKAVYDKIRAQFDCAAFVSVAQNPDMKKVLKDLRYELDKIKFSDIHNTTRDEKQLIDELGEFLVDKSSDKHCPKLMQFLRSGIYFASVDITNDKIKMKHTWGIQIPTEYHIDLQSLFTLTHEKTSMADMAVALIDEQYADMKKKFPKSAHKLWEKTPLDDINIDYAAVDAYVSYELYRKIRIFNYGTRHIVPTVPHESSPPSEYYDPYEGYL